MVLKKKKNWKSVKLERLSLGYIIMLDGNSLRTPSKNNFVIENKAIAHEVHREWLNVKGEITYSSMPYTKACFLSIDRSKQESLKLRNKLVSYGMSDLLCYRAEIDSELAKLQSKGWGPLIEWMQFLLKTTFRISHSIMPIEQSHNLEIGLTKLMAPLKPLTLTALNELVTLSGSLIIGIAIQKGKLSPERGWKLIRIDEDWQRESWGTTDEQKAEDKKKKRLFIVSSKILRIVRSG